MQASSSRPLARGIATLAAGAAVVFALSGCAATQPPDGPGAGSVGSVRPAPPEGEVIAQGTVMDTGGETELCLGAIAESYPPQCGGITLKGWTWEGIDGWESSGEVTWGAYAVQGRFDGESFTLTRPPVMLALYDPLPHPDPTGGRPGAAEEAELREIQQTLPDLLGESFLASYPDNGRLRVDVVWDDGTWQNAADHDYGEDVVLIVSAMRPVED